MDWPLAANIGQVVAAAFAIPSAVFIGFQIRAARQSSDLTSLLTFHREFADQERRLNASEACYDGHAFVEYCNLVEVYAAAHESRLFNSATRKQVFERLRDAIALVELSPARMDDWTAAASTPMAFSETKKFIFKYRADIDRSKKHLEQMVSSSSQNIA